MMADTTGASVWSVSYKPFGEVYSVTGTAANDNRFPGQWFQLETGLSYNWHRHYDPSLGRYTQPDPLGLVDGPSRYAYVGSDPQQGIDPEGLVELKHRWGRPNIGADHLGPRYPGGGGRGEVYRPKFGDLRSHAAKHGYGGAFKLYYRNAIINILKGKRFRFHHDGKTKLCYITRIGENSFNVTSTNKSGRRIFTYMENLTAREVQRSFGVTLPNGF